jgi:uroporphyrin-III C-methyltransferase
MYMGFEHLDRIVGRFIESGLSPELPACAVSRVSRSDQALVAATLGTIVRQIRERELPLPVVFIIGEHAVPEECGEQYPSGRNHNEQS